MVQMAVGDENKIYKRKVLERNPRWKMSLKEI